MVKNKVYKELVKIKSKSAIREEKEKQMHPDWKSRTVFILR